MNTFFLLLQINDAAFPIGGYSHSYGLETYIQHGIVRDYETVLGYIRQNIKSSFLYSELLAVRLAYQAAVNRDYQEIQSIEEWIYAAKSPKELREASVKLGNRFIKMASAALPDAGAFGEYRSLVRKERCSHSVAYGVFCAAAGIDQQEALGAYLYAQIGAVVTNCVKTIPLSQTDGQRILAGCHELFDQVLDQLNTLEKGDLCRSCPGLDIRSMQHEVLYSRLYMS